MNLRFASNSDGLLQDRISRGTILTSVKMAELYRLQDTFGRGSDNFKILFDGETNALTVQGKNGKKMALNALLLKEILKVGSESAEETDERAFELLYPILSFLNLSEDQFENLLSQHPSGFTKKDYVKYIELNPESQFRVNLNTGFLESYRFNKWTNMGDFNQAGAGFYQILNMGNSSFSNLEKEISYKALIAFLKMQNIEDPVAFFNNDDVKKSVTSVRDETNLSIIFPPPHLRVKSAAKSASQP